MNVFLCRLKTEGRDGKDRTREALELNEIWIGWDKVNHLVGKDLSYETVVDRAKELFPPTSSAPHQIGLFLGNMKKFDVVIVPLKGGSEFYAGQATGEKPRLMRVPWLENAKLPGWEVRWLNGKRVLPIASAPRTLGTDIHKNCTCHRFEGHKSLERWARRLVRKWKGIRPPERTRPLAEDGYPRASRKALKIIIPRHNRLSNDFTEWLKKKGYSILGREKRRVDVDFLERTTTCRAELKVCWGVKTTHAIREALGQLLEYNFYSGRERAKKWFIVLDRTPAQEDREFLHMLRRAMGFPLSICWQSRHTFEIDP